MADYRAISTGSDANDGSGWTAGTANATLAGAIADWVSGGRVFVNGTVATSAADTTVTFNVGTSTPIPVFTANTSDAYVKATSAAPTIETTTTSSAVRLNESFVLTGAYINTGRRIYLSDDNCTKILQDCDINYQYTSLGCELNLLETSGEQTTRFKNVSLTEDTACGLAIRNNGTFIWEGGYADITFRTIGMILPSAARHTGTDFSDIDFSASTITYLVDSSSANDAAFTARFINCEMPASFALDDGGMSNDGQIIELISSSASGDLEDYQKKTYRATITTQTTKYVTTRAHAILPSRVAKDGWQIEGPWMSKYLDTTDGTTVDITVYTADDFVFATPNKNQAWLEVVYLGTTGETLGTLGSGRPSDLLATTALDTSAASWTGSPTSTHELTASVTIAKTGYIGVRVVLGDIDLSGEATKEFYYDPNLQITQS